MKAQNSFRPPTHARINQLSVLDTHTLRMIPSKKSWKFLRPITGACTNVSCILKHKISESHIIHYWDVFHRSPVDIGNIVTVSFLCTQFLLGHHWKSPLNGDARN